MKEVNIPEGYQSIMPYLVIKDAQGFMHFMQTVFDAKEKMRVMRDETTVMHGELQVGESTIMFADSTADFTIQTAGMFIYVADADDAYNKALTKGATVLTPLSDQQYGRSGGIKDPYGNTWWITSTIK